MSKPVMKWRLVILDDKRHHIIYRFEDRNGISLNAWRRYLLTKFTDEEVEDMFGPGKYFDLEFRNMSQFGQLEGRRKDV